MENKELLENYREQINTLDKELIYLFFRRFEIVKQIWEVKKQEWKEALDSNRWNQLLNDNLDVAREFWLDDDFIIDVWNKIHDQSLKLEK